MAESISRSLRDGALEGELAPMLTIKDSLASPFASHVFSHILLHLSSNVMAQKSQSRGTVIVALSRSPSSYAALLKMKGVDAASSNKLFHVLDCYTDPLGWKDKIGKSGNVMDHSRQISLATSAYKTVKDMDQISSIFGLLHSDLHEERAAAVLEYMSTMVASVDPFHHSADGQRGYFENSLSEQNFTKGKFNVRFKRRNGRVRLTCEEFKIEHEGISFASVSSVDGTAIAGLLPKVQFNLQLSEKEQIERAKVVLPFEHQGNGRPIQIYDGRRSLEENNSEASPIPSGKTEKSAMGEIIYFRDSDDEMPDSDEDPDDDLDI